MPWTLIDQKLWLRATGSSVYVYDAKDEIVATHSRTGSTVRSTIAAHLPAEREPWRHRSRAFWEARADAMAPEVGEYVRAVFDSDDVLDLIRVVQAIVMHLEKFPVERAVATCKRALHFAVFTYAVIKKILRDGLDK